MKKILVPCDFSGTALHAFELASDIAKRGNGEVFVLHAIEFPLAYETTFGAQPYGFDRMALHDSEAEARKKFETLIAPHNDGSVKYTLHLDYGPITESVRHLIEEQHIDLVVMGTHGAHGMKEFFIGSNTERIVRFSQAPVLSVKARTRVSSIHHIVVPTTTDEDHSDFIIHLKALQDFFSATLHLLYINTPLNFQRDEDIKREFDRYTKRYALQNYTFTIRNDSDEESGIMNFAYDTHTDMIAMATHGRKGLAHLVSGSLAEDVVNHVNCPVWTCAIKSEKMHSV
jgi:nucleotide-binding universal stress UspA family protein